MRLVHVEQLDLSKVRREDVDIVEYLKETHPDLYKSLRKAVRAKLETLEGGAEAILG